MITARHLTNFVMEPETVLQSGLQPRTRKKILFEISRNAESQPIAGVKSKRSNREGSQVNALLSRAASQTHAAFSSASGTSQNPIQPFAAHRTLERFLSRPLANLCPDACSRRALGHWNAQQISSHIWADRCQPIAKRTNAAKREMRASGTGDLYPTSLFRAEHRCPLYPSASQTGPRVRVRRPSQGRATMGRGVFGSSLSVAASSARYVTISRCRQSTVAAPFLLLVFLGMNVSRRFSRSTSDQFSSVVPQPEPGMKTKKNRPSPLWPSDRK